MTFRYAAIAALGLTSTYMKYVEEKVTNIFGSDSGSTKAKVIELVPIGTNVNNASRLMEQSGFKCQLTRDVRFAEDNPNGGPQIIHGPSNTLWCDTNFRIKGQVFAKRYQVTFTLDEREQTSGIYVAISQTGS